MSFLKPLTDRFWIFIVLFFLLFVAALTVTVAIAFKNQPKEVPVEAHGH